MSTVTKRSLPELQIALKALTKNFTGAGAKARWVDFLYGGTIASFNWTVCIAAWFLLALVSFAFLLGTEQDSMTREIYFWITSLSLDQVITKTHIAYVGLMSKSIQIGLLIGFGSKLIKIISPEIKDYQSLAKQKS